MAQRVVASDINARGGEGRLGGAGKIGTLRIQLMPGGPGDNVPNLYKLDNLPDLTQQNKDYRTPHVPGVPDLADPREPVVSRDSLGSPPPLSVRRFLGSLSEVGLF